MNGTRCEVSRRRRVRNGERSSSCWATAQSKKQDTIPTSWLKLRARGRGRDAKNSSSVAALNPSTSGDVTVDGEACEEPQRGFFAAIFASQRPLVSEEPVDASLQIGVHASTASPSPSATSRSASTATFA